VLFLPADANVLGSAVLTMSLDELTEHMIAVCNNRYTSLVRVMIECAQLAWSQLPPVGVAGIKVARDYWVEQSVPASKLEHARVDCWNYLDERSASTNTVVPEYCAVRAVICVLYAEPPSDDLGDIVCFFNAMLQGALNLGNDEAFTATVGSVVDSFSANP
jgi:hypothetical protein